MVRFLPFLVAWPLPEEIQSLNGSGLMGSRDGSLAASASLACAGGLLSCSWLLLLSVTSIA